MAAMLKSKTSQKPISRRSWDLGSAVADGEDTGLSQVEERYQKNQERPTSAKGWQM